MKITAFKIMSILLSVILFTQCSEKNVPPIDDQLELISPEDIARIGEFHNECVRSMLSHFNWNADDFKFELIKQFNNLEHNQSGSKSAYTVDFIEEKCNTSKNIAELEEELSPEAFSIMEDAISLCENADSYDEIVAGLEKIEQSESLSSLDEIEKYTILVSASIWKNSAYYWLPADMGGSGEGYEYMTGSRKSVLKSSVVKWSLKEALVADGISGGVGLLGVAVAGALGPIGWTALAIAGGESAVCSVIGGF